MWNHYRRKGIAELRAYIPGEDLSAVSVSAVDIPGPGGMVARNPENHADQWYVAADYFALNFEPFVVREEFFTVFRRENLSRMPRFGHGDFNAPGYWGPMQWGCALAGETGELCNKLKKLERQIPTDPRPDDLTTEIADELADVFIYGDLLAAYFGFDLARIIATKFNRTSKKFGFPERL